MKVTKKTFKADASAISNAKSSALNRSKELINFSFKYLDRNNQSFKFDLNDATYFCEVLYRISELSSLSPIELLSNRSKTLRAHPIDWKDTTQNGFGFPKEDEIVDTPYQFSISKNEYGRIHGFFIDITFYIVWLDKEHQLYV